MLRANIALAAKHCPARLNPRRPRFIATSFPSSRTTVRFVIAPAKSAPMPLLTYAQTQPSARAIATDVREKKMPPWFADPTVGHFSNDPSLTNQEIATLVSWADSNAPQATRATPHRHRQLDARLAHSSSRYSFKNAQTRRHSRPRRRGLHLRNCFHSFHRRQMGATIRNTSLKPRERSPRRRLRSSSKFKLAQARTHWRALHRRRHARRPGPQRHTLHHRRHSSRLRARKFSRQLARGRRKIYPRRFRSRLPDALHDSRPRRHGPDQHWHRLRQATTRATRAHASTNQRPFRDSARRARFSCGSPRLVTQ